MLLCLAFERYHLNSVLTHAACFGTVFYHFVILNKLSGFSIFYFCVLPHRFGGQENITVAEVLS